MRNGVSTRWATALIVVTTSCGVSHLTCNLWSAESRRALTDIAGLDTPEDAEITRLVAALTGANSTGKVSFGTEGGAFQAAGIPTVVCGPGSIEQAHKPDEFIEIGQIRQCEDFLRRLLDRLAA